MRLHKQVYQFKFILFFKNFGFQHLSKIGKLRLSASRKKFQANRAISSDSATINCRMITWALHLNDRINKWPRRVDDDRTLHSIQVSRTSKHSILTKEIKMIFFVSLIASLIFRRFSAISRARKRVSLESGSCCGSRTFVEDQNQI